MNLKGKFDLDNVEFTDTELEIPYEESGISKEEIISGMGLIMHIALSYVNKGGQDVDDWWSVHSIAEAIYEELNND